MSFPTKLLGPGEEIYLDLRPNWSYLFWPSVSTALVLAGCVVAVVLWTREPSYVRLICLGVGLVAVVYLGARYLGWRTTTFVVTSQRIVYRTGVLRRTGREIPIGQRAGRDVSPNRRRADRQGRQSHRRVRRSARPGSLSRYQQA